MGRDQKVKYNLISITKSISKIFIPNFVCVLSNVRYKTYQTVFLFHRLGHACPRGGTLGYLGAEITFRPGDCPLCYLLLNHWMNPFGEVKRSNIIDMSISKIFIPNSLCVFSQIKDRKHIEQNFHR